MKNVSKKAVCSEAYCYFYETMFCKTAFQIFSLLGNKQTYVEVWLCFRASLHELHPEMKNSHFFQYVWYLFVLYDVTAGAVRTNIVIWTHFYDNAMSPCFRNRSCFNAPALFTAQWDFCSFYLTNSICDALLPFFYCMIACLMS